MNIMKISLLLLTAGSFFSFSTYGAPPIPTPNRGRMHDFNARWDSESPEAKAAMKRRYEIMILLQAYKIVPEELKEGLKAEIMLRLREDYIANRQHRENIIRRMETELESLRQKQEADTKEEVDSVMEAEFDRLCNMPIDMHNTPDNRHLQGRVSSKKD